MVNDISLCDIFDIGQLQQHLSKKNRVAERVQSSHKSGDVRATTHQQPTTCHQHKGAWESLQSVTSVPPRFQKDAGWRVQNTSHKKHNYGGSGDNWRDRDFQQQRPQRQDQAQVILGNGPATDLRAVSGNYSNHRNKICTGVFLSRLLPRTSPQTVQKHILTESGERLRVEKLNTRFDTYSSFFIRCEKPVRDRILNPYIWPKGSLVKLYYN